jgi:hypothetical protein
MKATYYVPQAGVFSKIIGKSINIHELVEMYMEGVANQDIINSAEKTSLMFLSKIIEETTTKGILHIDFEKETITLERTLVVVLGNKDNLYGIILKAENITYKDAYTLSTYRAESNITYINPEDFSSIFS